MPAIATSASVAALLRGKDPAVAPLYNRLLTSVRARMGRRAVVVDPKKTCIHLNAGKDGSAFLGVHIRKASVLLTIKSLEEINSPRVRKALKSSARRWYNDVVIESADEVDAELLGWIEASYEMSANT
jgi:hypothetical protein